MTDGIPWLRPYVESSVFIAWIRGEEVEGERAHISSHTLGLGESGALTITTSYLSIAEVFKKKGTGAPRLTDEQNGKILKFFESPYLVFVEVDRGVAEEANRLCRRFREQKLAPCDAIHIASALRAKCDYLLTWDEGMTRIEVPNLKIELPRIVGQSQFDFDGKGSK